MAELATSQPQQPPSPSATDDTLSSNAAPAFSFPLRSAPTSSSTNDDLAQQNDTPATLPSKGHHKRARTSINPLPDFSFSPRASEEPFSTILPPNPSPAEPSALNSPNRGRRHRRSASEYVGGISNPTSSSSQPMKVDFSQNSTADQARSPQFSFPLHPPPRTNNSEAIIVNQDDTTTSFATPDNLVPSADTRDTCASSTDHSTHQHIPPTSPPARVLFSDNVEFIPRAYSDTNSERDSTLSSPVKDDPFSIGPSVSPLRREMTNINDGTTDSPTEFSYSQPAVSWHSPLSELDENFDGDPTGAEFLDVEDSQPYSTTFYEATGASGQTYVPRSNAFESGMIDLDQALPPADEEDGPSNERRVNHIRNFQTARRSMHSASAMSGFMGSGMHYHRRAESAPLLAPIAFESNFEGFPSNPGMENVFEEEEEEEEETAGGTPQGTPDVDEHKGQASEHSNISTKGLGLGIGSTAQSRGSRERTSKSQTGPLSTRQHPPAPELTGYGTGEVDDKSIPDHTLAPPQAPFMTPDTPSGSSFSSPQRPGFSHASSEPSLVLPQSNEDIASVVSSRSTVASAPAPQQQPTNLRQTSGKLSMSTTSLGRSEETRKKRGSIASLSRLLGSSHSETRSDAGSDGRLDQDSDGAVVMRKKRPARLKRLFALWHREGTMGKE